MRWVDDPETGERVRKEVPVRFRTWFWKDELGNYMLEVRYGNKRLELKPKKSAIEIGEAKKLVPTIETLRDAVNAGELDKFLKAAKSSRRLGLPLGGWKTGGELQEGLRCALQGRRDPP